VAREQTSSISITRETLASLKAYCSADDAGRKVTQLYVADSALQFFLRCPSDVQKLILLPPVNDLVRHAWRIAAMSMAGATPPDTDLLTAAIARVGEVKVKTVLRRLAAEGSAGTPLTAVVEPEHEEEASREKKPR
jgi:hypothetical protein